MHWRRGFVIVVLVAGIGGAITLAGCADSEGVNPTSPEVSTEALSLGHGGIWRALDLTDAQREKLQALREKHRREMQDLRAGLDGIEAREAKQEARKAFRETMHAELMSILTTEQTAKLEQFRRERKGYFGGKMHHGARLSDADRAELRARRMARLTETLGLTTEQQAQIEGAFKDVRSELRGVSHEGRQAFRAERKAALDARLKEILTAEQYQKFLGTRTERGAGNPDGRSSN